MLATLLLASACDGRTPSDASAQPPAVSIESPGRKASVHSVQLDDAAVRRAGIELVSVSESTFEPEVEAYGRVLDPAPIADAVANVESARAAAETAARELGRVEALARDEQNASIREAEAARAAAARARADLAMAESRLVGAAGPELAQAPELPSLARRLARREAALVRVDVPGNSPRPVPEPGAHLALYPGRDTGLAARLLGPAPDSDPMLPGWGFFFLVSDAAPPVGTPVRARLRSQALPVVGVTLPGAALLRHDGRLFVFVALGGAAFERRGVTARALPDGSWFVSEGVKAGERVVVSGAAELLSEDLLPAGSDEAL